MVVEMCSMKSNNSETQTPVESVSNCSLTRQKVLEERLAGTIALGARDARWFWKVDRLVEIRQKP